MLNTYEAIEFREVFTKGGRTEPWLIQVLVEDNPKPYVVKLFKTDEVEEDNAVAREVFGSVLANEFELSVPEPALIHFSPAFVNTLPKNLQDLLFFRDNRLKFGSEYCSDVILLKNDLPANQVNKFIHDLPTIYAFDTLINNRDRGRYKTNILVSTISDDYYIFDHERAFKNISNLTAEIKGNYFSDLLKDHVLFNYLHKKREKNNVFDTFHFFLERLKPSILDQYDDMLRKNNLNYSDLNQLKTYLYSLQQKADWFVKLLQQSIS